ncbi:hypothetical protein QBC34DRAFT_469068 [Podospora aff. communis PSN243]|uniref:Peptidase M3A/M3B catalytic domain-containing protein n=1 Tax=Podospora aff. communis PSN243 TaxID=3040156 RepID=A0AAV9GG38_9PEZI|nr:hypothetical protein QBC34DRAFT_469068 [Podospora aff. communis PSN243]
MADNNPHRRPYRIPTADEISGILADTVQKYHAMQDEIARIPVDKISFENLVIPWVRVEKETSIHITVFRGLLNVGLRDLRDTWGNLPRTYFAAVAAWYQRPDLSARFFAAKRLMDKDKEAMQGKSVSKWGPWEDWLAYHIEEFEVWDNRPPSTSSADVLSESAKTEIAESEGKLDHLRNIFTEMYNKTPLKTTYDVLAATHSSEARKREWMAGEAASAAYAPVCRAMIYQQALVAQLRDAKNYGELKFKTQAFPDRPIITDLLHRLGRQISVMSERLVSVLRQIRARDLGISTHHTEREMPPWDYFYYQQKLVNVIVGLGPDEVAQYFPMSHTIPAIFDVVGPLFGGQIKEIDPQTLDPRCLWHENTCLSLHQFKNIVVHELGHALHRLFVENKDSPAGGKYDGFAPDFVEIPSHVLEYILDQKDVVQRIIRHPTDRTKAAAPVKDLTALASNLSEAFCLDRFFASIDNHRMAEMDLYINGLTLEEAAVLSEADLQRKWYAISDNDLGTNLKLEDNMNFHGYAAGCFLSFYAQGLHGKNHSHSLAQSFAADVFITKLRDNFWNPKVWDEYRQQLLRIPVEWHPGADELRKYFGRMPQPRLIEALGVVEKLLGRLEKELAAGS